MISPSTPLLRRVATLLVVVLVAACGGGGGAGAGAGGGSGTPSGGTEETPTGLVPAAPEPGAALVARGATLRPLKSGATSTFRDESQPSMFEVRVVQTDTSDGRFIETRTDTSNQEPEVSTVWHDSSGQVHISQSLALSDSRSIALDAVELPSPVRQGAQWTLFDRRVEDSGIDADGDGNADAFDVAVWSRVVGTEPLSWAPHLRRVDTIRIDTWIAMRAVLRSGQVQPVVLRRMSNWYVNAVGVVRSVTYADDDIRVATDEVLLGYDAIDSGFGHVMRQRQFPAGDDGTVYVEPDEGLIVALSDRLLALGSYRMSSVMIRYDPAGRLQTVVPVSVEGTPLKMFAFGDNVRLIARRNATTLTLWSVDRSGVTATSATATLDFDVPGSNVGDLIVVQESGADRFWVIHTVTQFLGGVSTFIVVRTFDAEGRALSEVSLPVGSSPMNVRAAAFAGGLAVTWNALDTARNETLYHYTRLDSGGAVVAEREFQLQSTQFATAVNGFSAIGSNDGAWLVWSGPGLAAQDVASPHAWRIDASGAVLTGDASRNAALASAVAPLPGVEEPATHWPGVLTVGGNRWFAWSGSIAPLYPGNTVPFGRHMQLAEIDADSAATGVPLRRIELPLPVTGFTYSPPLVLSDRVIVIGRDSQNNRTLAVVWR